MDEVNLDRSIDLLIEQEEIIDQVEKIRDKCRGRGFSWNRFRGDAICRIVAYYLNKHLPKGFKVTRLAWIEGCENEFDLLIVDEDAKPMGFTGAYPKNRVHLLIEVKGSGVFYKREEVKKRLSELFKAWRDKTGKSVFYLSIWEAHAHVQEVLRALGKDAAFILVGEKEGVKHGEWERFLRKVDEVLKP